MPEGDTIHRTASTLDRWIGGRVITAARGSALSPAACDSLVGDAVMAVEANGKHVLMRLASGRTIHSHMRMRGAWHVYPSGRAWHRPGFEARLVLEAGERLAVCFNAPVVTLAKAPAVDHLGPDLITEPVDFDAIADRVALQPTTVEVGDLLLDQRVASGIGNIWRCETLFRHGVHPRTPLGAVPSPVELYQTASKLLRASTWGRRDSPWVYRRTGQPCRRCGARIESAVVGTHARRAYWCPDCQPLVPRPADLQPDLPST